MDDAPQKLCECGCGKPAPISKDSDATRGYVKGQPRRFIHGHHRRIIAPGGKRWCSGCQDFRPLDAFSPKARSYCRVCANNKRQEWIENNSKRESEINRKKKLKRRYSITPEEYDGLLAQQRGLCAICEESPEGVLHVDHDHVTGAVRGLLCNTCNVGIGSLKDDSALLRAAAEYLEDHHDRRLAAAT